MKLHQIDILTPTYNQPEFLPCCVQSVYQNTHELRKDVAITHYIQNGGDTLSIVEVNQQNYQLDLCQQEDQGMYDALNTAFARSSGEIVGHLNSDEQYLPGTLNYVYSYFQNHPKADVVFGGVTVVRPTGEYVCTRKAMPPTLLHTSLHHLSTFTASCFYRRASLEQLSTFFDSSFRSAADADLICRMILNGFEFHSVEKQFALFVDSGENLALHPESKKEQKRIHQYTPAYLRSFKPLVKTAHRFRKLTHGAYQLTPYEYPFISPEKSVKKFKVEKPTGLWKR